MSEAPFAMLSMTRRRPYSIIDKMSASGQKSLIGPFDVFEDLFKPVQRLIDDLRRVGHRGIRRLPASVTIPFAIQAAPMRSMESLRTYIISLCLSRPTADFANDMDEKSKLIAPVHSRCTMEP